MSDLIERICPNCWGKLKYIPADGVYKCPDCRSVFEQKHSNIDEYLKLIIEASEKHDQSLFSECIRTVQKELSNNDDAKTNSQYYWLLFQAKNRISFVFDKADNKRKPTIMDSKILNYGKSLLDDEDFLKALEYSNDENRRFYLEQGNYIEKVRLQIIEKQLNPKFKYDVFISFKKSIKEEVTDANGNKKTIEIETEDKKIAEQIYSSLKSNGIKCFYSEAELNKNMAGEDYESVIFQAIASSKVFILIGTKPEYIYENWVQSEWNRYLYYMNNFNDSDESILSRKADNSFLLVVESLNKTEWDKYPSEISKKQALETHNFNFKDELISRVKSIIGMSNGIEINKIDFSKEQFKQKNTKKEQSEIKTLKRNSTNLSKKTTIAENVVAQKVEYISTAVKLDASMEELIDRAFISLEMNAFDDAKTQFDKIIADQPTAKAYYGLIMCSIEAKDDKDFVEKSFKFNKFEYFDSFIQSRPDKKLANRCFDLLVESFKSCMSKKRAEKAIDFFNCVVRNAVPQRDEIIKSLKDIIESEDFFVNFNTSHEKIIQAYLSTINPSEVDKYIDECLELSSWSYKNNKQVMATSLTKKVLDIDDGNKMANYYAFCISENITGISNLETRPWIRSSNIDKFENYLKCLTPKKTEEILMEIYRFMVSYASTMSSGDELSKMISTLSYILSILDIDNTEKAQMIEKFVNTITDNSKVNRELIIEKDGNILADEVVEKILCWTDNVDVYVGSLYKLGKLARKCKDLNSAKNLLKKGLEHDDANSLIRYELFLANLGIVSGSLNNVFINQIDKIFQSNNRIEELGKLFGSLQHSKNKEISFEKIIDALEIALIGMEENKNIRLKSLEVINKSLMEKTLAFNKETENASQAIILREDSYNYTLTKTKNLERYGQGVEDEKLFEYTKKLLGYLDDKYNKRFIEISLSAAERFLLKGNYEKALEFYRLALDRDKNNFEAHHGIFMCSNECSYFTELLLKDNVLFENQLYENLIASAHKYSKGALVYASNIKIIRKKLEAINDPVLIDNLKSTYESIKRNNFDDIYILDFIISNLNVDDTNIFISDLKDIIEFFVQRETLRENNVPEFFELSIGKTKEEFKKLLRQKEHRRKEAEKKYLEQQERERRIKKENQIKRLRIVGTAMCIIFSVLAIISIFMISKYPVFDFMSKIEKTGCFFIPLDTLFADISQFKNNNILLQLIPVGLFILGSFFGFKKYSDDEKYEKRTMYFASIILASIVANGIVCYGRIMDSIELVKALPSSDLINLDLILYNLFINIDSINLLIIVIISLFVLMNGKDNNAYLPIVMTFALMFIFLGTIISTAICESEMIILGNTALLIIISILNTIYFKRKGYDFEKISVLLRVIFVALAVLSLFCSFSISASKANTVFLVISAVIFIANTVIVTKFVNFDW